jgi:hypothetical protein
MRGGGRQRCCCCCVAAECKGLLFYRHKVTGECVVALREHDGNMLTVGAHNELLDAATTCVFDSLCAAG